MEKRPRTAVRPTRYSAFCYDDADPLNDPKYACDTLTGVATYEGHRIFELDVKNGDLRISPEESMTRVMDALNSDQTRRTIDMDCVFYGHYEWSPVEQGAIITTSIKIQLRDSMCWASKKRAFTEFVLKYDDFYYKKYGSLPSVAKWHEDCRSLCRSTPTCSHYSIRQAGNLGCWFAGPRCTGLTHSCIESEVVEKYPGCGERHSCLDLQVPNHYYLSGRYCFAGENVEEEGQGPVYYKHGHTRQAWCRVRHVTCRDMS